MEIHIVTAIDNNYVQHCGVMLRSLFFNNKYDVFYIHILQYDLTVKNKNILEKLVNNEKSFIKFYQICFESLKGAPDYGHVSIATYYRIYIASILPLTISKVIYLDSDIVVKKSLRPLYELELYDNLVGACEEPVEALIKEKLGLLDNQNYFNAGVLLINLEKWRVFNLESKALTFIRDHPEKITFWDQDVLNYLFKGKWLLLHPSWNVSHYIFDSNFNRKTLKMNQGEIEMIKRDPAILHFSGAAKPWQYYSKHPLKQEYYKYLEMTYWKRFRTQNSHEFRNRVIQYMKNLFLSNKK